MKTCLRLLLAILMPAMTGPRPALASPPTVEQALTDQEHAVLMGAKADETAAAYKDAAAAYERDKSKEATPAIVDALRGQLRAATDIYVKTEIKDNPKAPTRMRLTNFELEYCLSRIQSFEKTAKRNMAKPFGDLMDQADKAKKEGAATAPDVLLAKLRGLLRKDLQAYADPKGAAPAGEAFEAWAVDVLKADATLDKANAAAAGLIGSAAPEAPKKEEPEAKPKDELQKAVEAIFDNPIERAVIEHVARKKDVKAETAKLQKMKTDNDKTAIDGLRAKVNASVADYLGHDGKPEDPILEGLGASFAKSQPKVTDQMLLAHYCDSSAYQRGAAEPDKKPAPAKEQAETLKKKSIWAAGDATDEGAKGAADFNVTPTTRLGDRCQNYFNEKKQKENFKDSPPENKETVDIPGPVPEPTLAADIEPDKPKKKEIPYRKLAIGAGAGALAFGIMGFLLGGPFGALMGAAVGGLFMGGVTALNNEVI